MLALGLVAEWKVVPRAWAVSAGMVAFFASFGLLLTHYVRGTGTIGIVLFLFVYVVWGMYGVAALQDSDCKNISYNLLDIVSKNVYGLILFVYSAYVLS